jgi:hypothetical protein
VRVRMRCGVEGSGNGRWMDHGRVYRVISGL